MSAKAYDKKTAAFAGWLIQNIPDTLTDEIMDGWMNNPTATKKFLAGLVPPETTSAKAVVVKDIIRVDRSIRPAYPDWTGVVMHPELENTGPERFDLAKVRDNLWLHDGQKNGGRVTGQVIYDHLKSTDTLKTCLGLRDGEEIQKKGIEVFRQYFNGKAIFLWKSVVRHRDGGLSVPSLCEDGGRVVIGWYWLDNSWGDASPAVRFAS